MGQIARKKISAISMLGIINVEGMENELKNWAESKGIEISIKDIKKPYYVSGHEVYKLNENERYKVLSFSKSK